MRQRIFTFGCSFTEYSWPTWADIILYNNEGYNLGVSGSGFDSILYRLVEADRVFKLTSNDKVIIVFTTPIRWDLIVDNKWSVHGQVLFNNFTEYENKLFCIDGLLFKSFYNIQLIDEFLNNRNIAHIYGSVNNLYENIGNYFESFDISSNTKELMTYISEKIPIDLVDFHSYLHVNKKEWIYYKKYKDGTKDYHPRPKHYFNWVNNILLNKFDVNINISEELILDIEKNIDVIHYNHDIIPILSDKYPELYSHRINNSIFIENKYEHTKLKML